MEKESIRSVKLADEAMTTPSAGITHDAPNYEIFESPEEKAVRLRLIDAVHDKVLRRVPFGTLIPGLNLSWIETPRKESNCFYVLSLALILQGTKHLLIGDNAYNYGTGSMLVTSVDMPTSYELIDVRPSKPFVSLSLKLDPTIIAELLAEEQQRTTDSHDVFMINQVSLDVLEDFDRLLRLLDHPEQLQARLPMVIRDIHYLALAGRSGDCLRALFAPDSTGQRIRKVIHWLRKNFRESIEIDQMAEVANMAPTTFHRHFKAFTSFSPLQYQKRLRLYEAQQFLMRGAGDVNAAAYAVGYRSPQQFSRDYRRLFGDPPGRSTRQKRADLLRA